MITIEKEISGQIMSTDIYISISANSNDNEIKETIEKEISCIINQLQQFAEKYSRFIKNNFLDNFNSTTQIKYDEEFSEILKLCSYYYKKTNGIFDPTILNDLLASGYVLSKKDGFVRKNDFQLTNIPDTTATPQTNQHKYSINDISILSSKNIISKPLDLKIDLGGIGKGFIADKIANTLKGKYEDFCISIGGDMYLSGVDRRSNYSYWAIEIDSPFTLNDKLEMPSLLLNNLAIATSGIDKRNWEINGKIKNHIIDPNTHKSINNELVCVTVIASTVTEADVYAKTLLILGLENGAIFCENHSIPAIFIKKDKTVIVNSFAQKYAWKE